MASTASSGTQVSEKEQQKIIDGFQKLREQQQNTITELSKLQSELREHG